MAAKPIERERAYMYNGILPAGRYSRSRFPCRGRAGYDQGRQGNSSHTRPCFLTQRGPESESDVWSHVFTGKESLESFLSVHRVGFQHMCTGVEQTRPGGWKAVGPLECRVERRSTIRAGAKFRCLHRMPLQDTTRKDIHRLDSHFHRHSLRTH